MKNYFNDLVCKFYEVGIKHRLCIFALIIALWGLAFFSFSKIELNNSSVVFLPDSSIQMKRMAQGMDIAPFSRLLYVDLYHSEGNIESILQAAQILKSHIPPSLAVHISQNMVVAPEKLMELIPTFFDEEAEKYAQKNINPAHIIQSVQNSLLTLSTFANNSLIQWLRADPLNLKEIVIQNLPIRQNLPTNNMVSEYVISADKKHVLLVFQPMFSMHDTDAATKILAHIRHAKMEMSPDIKVNLNGGLMHTAANSEIITMDIKNIAIFSFLGIAFIYIFLVRSLAGLWLLLTPLLAVSFSLGIMTWISVGLSGLALGFGAAILGIAEDYAVHMHFALQKEKNTDRVLRFLSIPLFQGFLLNSSGFIILLFSGIPAIRQLAGFALLSLFFGFIIAIFILPLCPRFYKRSPTLMKVSASYANCYAREPVLWKSFATVAILLICSIIVFFNSKIDVSPKSMGVALNNAEMNAESFMSVWGANTGDLLIIENSDQNILFENARKITKIISENTNNNISSLAYFLPSQEEQKENMARWNNFIQKNASSIKTDINAQCQKLGAEPVIFEPFFQILHKNTTLISLESLSKNGFANLVDFFTRKSGDLENPLFQTLLMSSNKIDMVLLEKELIDDPVLLEQIYILSPEVLESEIRSVFYSEAQYVPLTLVFCAILLYLCFFNFSKVFLALVPPLFAVLCVLVGMYLLQSPITLGAIAAFPLVIGLALDHGVIITHDLEHGVDFGIRKALLVSSLTTCMGMGLLAFAEHPTLRAMGQVIFIGLFMEIIVSLYVLPLLCKRKNSIIA